MQNTKRIWVPVLALVAVSLAAPAPGEDGGYARRGLYIGAGGVYALEQFDLPSGTVSVAGSPPVHVDVDGGNSWGAEGRVGYRFHPNVAAEGQLQYFDEFGLDLHASPGSSGQVATIDGMSVMGNVKGYPLTGRVQPYLLGGIGLLWLQLEDAFGAGLEDHEVGFAGHVGVGVDAYLTDNLLLNLEASYLLPAGDLSDFRMIPISLGMQYRFD